MEVLLVLPEGPSFALLLPRLLPASRSIALSVDSGFMLKKLKSFLWLCMLSNFGTFFRGISITRLLNYNVN